MSDLLGRARRDSLNGGVEGFLGDEELEDVGGIRGIGEDEIGGTHNYGIENAVGNDDREWRGNRDGDGGRRLSRELECGFMDDSSDDEGDDDRRRRAMLVRG